MTKSSTVDHLEHCDLLEEEIDRFAALVDTAPLSAPVPSCPGWNVGDLVLHLGTVHRWAERLVSVRAPGRIASSDMALDEGPLSGEWMRSGGESLLATLRSADPDAEMWAWGRDQHVRFWSRRELHETLVHRFDLELALGAVPSTAGRVAADTVDEFLDNLAAAEYFSPNVARLRGKGEQISFVATDTGDAWNVVLQPDRFDVSAVDASAAACLSGEAATLALVLYRRLPVPDSGLVLGGQHELVELWIANSALE